MMPGQPGGGQYVAFGDLIRLDQLKRGGLQPDFTACDRFPEQRGFAGDIHHAGFTGSREMRELRHAVICCQPMQQGQAWNSLT